MADQVPERDPTTFSNYWQIATEHIDFSWSVDFQKRVITGSAVHKLKVKDDGVKEVIFDVLALDVHSVEVNENPTTEAKEPCLVLSSQLDALSLQYEIKHNDKVMGSALHIPLSVPAVGSVVEVKIAYSTTKDCTALQWLEKEQTQGKKFPFLFSQCQPIHARSLAPVQDTPSVKLTYTAEVRSVLPILMSAIRQSPPSESTHDGIGEKEIAYTYSQLVPIPSYLIAIAAGDVVYRPFSPPDAAKWTSGVWAETELVEDAHEEFSEATVQFLTAAENYLGEYRFHVYDLLVLPPSFPYGGMENPCLTFLTPTLIAGDKSLTGTVIHELSHSWFGNGITHAHASHFWLNEGWTTFTERLLQQLILSPAARGLSAVIGYKSLLAALQQFEDTGRSKYQRLVIPFETGEDPDTAYGRVPYEKGSNMLYYLEHLLGGLAVFLPYMRNYLDAYMGKSITTYEWKDHLYAYFRERDPSKVSLLDSVDWDAWFYGEGLTIPVQNEFDTSLAKDAFDLADRWDVARSVHDLSLLAFEPNDVKSFAAGQTMVFLERLESYPALPSAHLFHFDNLYQFSTTTSPELRLRFYLLVTLDPTSEAAKHFAPDAAKWVVGNDGTGVIKGRMKFCRPVFRQIYKVDQKLAVDTFEPAKDQFHPIARRLIAMDLNLSE
ncbi:leukotriene-A4 hydrolase [Coniophora puteana RWD-64-598 SS2]|uniref:Leukotriene-A4 hydrolase n=1 Tax=Coniophora puteana (strain RWD-64-598) TaxID=741705 RepID=A0A5M3MRY3_CONPW|nr:leukotriene-A4 hydrolase [Coniophora puteana RWD-64-598 SS2]EIW81415.1 leukotriene-A4 hydrolase [Coniophora puteana RWD-64-598 SS2]